ncbi:ABC transporter ATP-binding protein [Prosthecomicrobium sp. N25]|uniref:ABC transporter ATP-binding protein n=1 Tax=Prosthecomicrobium sp. N25 TaxID=3129254 RepID=UPI0030784AE0
MGAIAIRAEGLGKTYRLGVDRSGPGSLRELAAGLPGRLLGRGPSPRPPAATPLDFTALRDVSFEVGTGEVLGIIGPNGAGKSTLLKILARIVEPTTGRAEIHGRLGALIEVGTGFHGELTGRENIFLNGAILGMGRAEIRSKLDEIVDFAGVGAFLDTPVKRYSSGMYLRLAFAVAAHLDPDILIIDEVLAVGDAAFQRKCIAKAEESARSGRTVLFVSHQMSLVQRVCGRAILLEGGRLTADGATGEIVARYLAGLESRTGTPVGERTDRAGRGRLRVRAIDASGEAGAPLAAGAPATIRVEAEGPRGPCRCQLTLIDDHGDPAVTFDTQDHSEADRGGAGFALHLPALLIRPGRYRLDVALIADHGVEDHVEAAAYLDIAEGHVGDRPVRAAAGFGAAVIPHVWTLRA